MEDRNNNQQYDYYEEPEEKFDLQGYIRRYLRYWYLFPIFITACLIGAWYFLQITQPIYSAKTTMLIKDSKEMGVASVMEDMAQFTESKVLDNEMEILKSQMLMAQVVKELNLEVSIDAKDGLKTVDLYGQSPATLKAEIISAHATAHPMILHMVDSLHFRINDDQKLYPFGKPLRNQWGLFTVNRGVKSIYQDINVHFHDVAGLAGGFSSRLNVNILNPKSTVLQLSFDDTSVQRAKDVLNKLLDVYIQSSLNDKNSEASNTLKFIETRLGLITGELDIVEKNVEGYKTSRGLTDISTESQLFLENVQESDSKLNEINNQIAILESIDYYIEHSEDGEIIAPATNLVSDPGLVSLLGKFNELISQKERYERTVQPGNPLLETITTQMATTRQAIKENVQNLRRGMDMTKKNLEGINTRFSSGLRSIPQKEREYVGIKRQQTIKENLYLYLLQKREETALAYASTVTDSRLIDAPVSSYIPIKPVRSSIWLGALGAGIVIPVMLISLIFMLNNTVQTRDEIEKVTHASVLGEIGMMKGPKGQKESEGIIKMTSRSAVAEQFRALRTNLQYLGDGSCRVIMFTSSIGSEGKSFVSINLAASLAYSDKKVILLGLDLRKPTLHDRLEVQNKKGVSNYMVGQKNLNELIQATSVHPKFDVMTSGPIPPNPSELISNGRLPELLAELRAIYDYILIDSAPYGLVTDAALIAEHVDATLYLVRFNYTLKDHLKRISEIQRTKRFNNLTVIYNGVNYGSGYGYGYGYGGYGYGYYTEDGKNKALDMGSRLKKMVGKG